LLLSFNGLAYDLSIPHTPTLSREFFILKNIDNCIDRWYILAMITARGKIGLASKINIARLS